MKDSERSHIHLTTLRSVLYFEQWMEDSLVFDDIHIKPEHMPLNTDEDDDFIPDPHAPFGIMRAKQMSKQSQWKDLALKELLDNGPGCGDNTIVPSYSGPQWGNTLDRSSSSDGYGHGSGHGSIHAGGGESRSSFHNDSSTGVVNTDDRASNLSPMLDRSDLANRSSSAHDSMESLEFDVSDSMISQGPEHVSYHISSTSISRNSTSDGNISTSRSANERRETFNRTRAPR